MEFTYITPLSLFTKFGSPFWSFASKLYRLFTIIFLFQIIVLSPVTGRGHSLNQTSLFYDVKLGLTPRESLLFLLLFSFDPCYLYSAKVFKQLIFGYSEHSTDLIKHVQQTFVLCQFYLCVLALIRHSLALNRLAVFILGLCH